MMNLDQIISFLANLKMYVSQGLVNYYEKQIESIEEIFEELKNNDSGMLEKEQTGKIIKKVFGMGANNQFYSEKVVFEQKLKNVLYGFKAKLRDKDH